MYKINNFSSHTALQSLLLQRFQSNTIPDITCCNLFRTFSAVALFTEHLTVFYDCTAAVAPRRDMVAFHELVIKFLSAMRTDMLLLLPDCQFNVFRKSTKIKTALIACQHIRYDAVRILHLTVSHQG